MSHYKPYPAYKDSGVEWIGKVPEGWEVARIKRKAQIATDRCSTIPEGFTYIGLEDVESGSGQYKPTATTSRQSDDSTVGLFQKGDVLYGKLRPYLRKCITGPFDGACSTESLVLKPSSLSARWLQNWLLTNEVTQQIEAGCDGAKMPRTDWEHVGSIPIPVPHWAEQDAILTTLDRETARIDALIAKKTEFIELLARKRQALTTHAVTKGLDPNVKMKDSGVEWIGEVPEHWEVRPVYSLATVRNGYPFASELFKHEGVESDRLIRIRDIAGDDEPIFTEEICPVSAVISNGDVLIGMDGDFNVHRWMRGPAKLNQRMCVVSGQTEEITQFLSRCLPIPLRIINELAYATTVKHLSSYEVLHTRIAVPPTHELTHINAFLDRETARIDALIEKVQLSIDLLKKRRSALITAAVTGQIDLREST
jgi:type I restriction enzyme S subunit